MAVTATDLNRHSAQILWPPRPRLGRRIASQAPSVRAIGGVTQQFELTLPSIESRVLRGTSLRCKFLLGGNATLEIPAGGDSRQLETSFGVGSGPRGSRQIAMAVKAEVIDGVTTEIGAELSSENLHRIAQLIARRDWSLVGSELFRGKIAGGFRVTEEISIASEFAPVSDDDLCFLSGKIAVKLRLPVNRELERLGLPRGSQVAIQLSPEIRVGLEPQAWRKIAERIGGSALRRAVARMPRAASRMLMRSLTRMGVWGVAIGLALGSARFSAYICNRARDEGARWALYSKYCRGYVGRVARAHRVNIRLRNQLERMGWRDAGVALTERSQRLVEQTLIRHFGSALEGFWPWDEQRVSRVGNIIHNESEVDIIRHCMARYLAREGDEFADLLARINQQGRH